MRSNYKIIKFASFFLWALAFYACAAGEDSKVMKLKELHSGYVSDKDAWLSFLQCWEQSRDLSVEADEGWFLRYGNKKITEDPIDTQLGRISLPSSVIDFYDVYQSMGGVYRDENIDDGIGLFPPGEIQLLSVYFPELLKTKNEWSSEASDAEYFRYGIEQNDAAIRTGYQNNAIVIGQYGFSDYELLVLYPDSVTKDGEMETAIFAHASEARAPSFPEMMRQLSYYFNHAPDSIPLYSQDNLKGSCAEKIYLENVWWK